MNIHKSNMFFIFFMLLILNWGCVKNPCESTKTELPYFISDTTKAFISNYIGTERIIFTNKSNEEIIFQVSEIIDSMISYTGEIVCKEDSSNNQIVEGKSQYIELSLRSTIFEKPFIISLVEHPQIITKRENDENVLISFGAFSESIKQENVLMVHYTLKNSNYTSLKDSLIIGNKVFYNVIKNTNQQNSPKFEIMYTKTQGIIYIKERTTNQEYIYKKKK